ncbi:MAG: hypothetical protein ABIN95_11970 [Mucilaginibacter sp.]
MEIKYLVSLRDNPTWGPYINRGISMEGIMALEQQYNSGQPFPKTLRELLYLAGDLCNIFDYGTNATQQKLQQEAREMLIEENRTINRPFYAIEVRDGEIFMFVYLDESDDPMVHEAVTFLTDEHWNRNLEMTLSQFCDSSIEDVKRGENPF